MSGLSDRIEKAIEDAGFAQTIEERQAIAEEVEDAVSAWFDRRLAEVRRFGWSDDEAHPGWPELSPDPNGTWVRHDEVVEAVFPSESEAAN